MDEETIGTNAGKVWHILHENDKATRHQLINKTGLEAADIDAAIGWLARENKIYREGEFFALGKTNMEKTISVNANILLNVLKSVPYSLSVLHEITDLNAIEIHQAIGWLSREGSINLISEPAVKEIIDEQEETLQFLKNEVENLENDLEKRNEIICQLSRQITEKQTEFMHQAQLMKGFNDELEKKDSVISLNNTDLVEKDHQINMLQQEIQSLHEDIQSRNQIITDLSKQLTTAQMESIRQVHAFEELHKHVVHEKPHVEPQTQTSIQQRLSNISSVQENLEVESEIKSFDMESRLYHASSPVLDIQEQQGVEPAVVHPKTIDEIHQTVDQAILEKIQKLRNQG
jgi:peptidoglycan hydrolase CwlO-like protein